MCFTILSRLPVRFVCNSQSFRNLVPSLIPSPCFAGVVHYLIDFLCILSLIYNAFAILLLHDPHQMGSCYKRFAILLDSLARVEAALLVMHENAIHQNS